MAFDCKKRDYWLTLIAFAHAYFFVQKVRGS